MAKIEAQLRGKTKEDVLLGGGLVAVAQVTTVRKVQAHQTTVGWHQSLIDLQVGWATTQGLYVDAPLGRVEVEGFEGTLLAKKFNLVNVLVSAIVASTRLALGVLVGHGRAKRVEDSTGGDILGGDQDNGLPLALDLLGLESEAVSGYSEYCCTAVGYSNGIRTMIWATSGSVSRRDFSSIYDSLANRDGSRW